MLFKYLINVSIYGFYIYWQQPINGGELMRKCLAALFERHQLDQLLLEFEVFTFQMDSEAQKNT